MNDWEKQQMDLITQSKNKLKDVVQFLKREGIELVEIEYSGSGDSGSFESVNYFKNKKPWNWNGKTPEWGSDDDIQEKLDEVIGNLCTNFIDGDWYNNEGGQGKITLNVKKKSLFIEAEYNRTEVDTDEQEVHL